MLWQLVTETWFGYPTMLLQGRWALIALLLVELRQHAVLLLASSHLMLASPCGMVMTSVFLACHVLRLKVSFRGPSIKVAGPSDDRMRLYGQL